MLRCNSEVSRDPGPDSDDALKFLKSLQELKELRSQIHYAADYCETAFLDAKEKRTVIDNTKEYICRAVVTVVDHLGCVSANLDSRLRETDRVSEAELRINCFKQKVLLHEQHSQTLVLPKRGPKVVLPKHFSRYISPPKPNQEKPKEEPRELDSSGGADRSSLNKPEVKIEEDMPLFIYTSGSYKIPLYKSPSLSDAESFRMQSLVSVRDGLSIPSETKRVSFHFQMTRKNGRRILHWRSMQQNDILSIIRRSKKEPLKLLKF